MVSDKILDFLKKEDVANPFCSIFDLKVVSNRFSNPSQEEESLLLFLLLCNRYYSEISSGILSVFEKLNASPDDLVDLIFAAVNNGYFHYFKMIISQGKNSFVHEVEQGNFKKIENENGEAVEAKFALEIGVDILAELLSYISTWKPKTKSFINKNEINEDEFFKHFNVLWGSTNILINLRNSAYNTAIYENGKVIFRGEDEVRIENGLKSLSLIKTAGEIRQANHIYEYRHHLRSLYEKVNYKRKRLSVDSILGGTVTLKIGLSKEPFYTKANADANIVTYYPHFKEVKLEVFDSLTLFDLVEMFSLIQEAIEGINYEIPFKDGPLELANCPIRLNEENLVSALVETTGHSRSSVEKFLSSLCADVSKPFFWASPFYRSKEWLYFSLLALSSPNICLYLDNWLKINGTSLSDKELKFKNLVYDEVKATEKNQFKFEVVNLEDVKSDSISYENNILIETSSLYLFIEVKAFDFPIEIPNCDKVIIGLGKGVQDLEEKAKHLTQSKTKLEEKEVFKFVVVNYPNFSGLNINNIPIVDLPLLLNYISTGCFRRAKMAMSQGKSFVSDIGSLSYYSNEEEFNENIKMFLREPVPVHYILQRFFFKEQSVTPEPIKFIVDLIDHVQDEELVQGQIDYLSGLLEYGYFAEPEDTPRKNIDEAIIYSLNEIFSKLAFGPYKTYSNRVAIYKSVKKVRSFGFAHLSFFIIKEVQQLKFKKVKRNGYFKSIAYVPDSVFKLIERLRDKMSGNIRVSEFIVEKGTFNDQEARQIISLALDHLASLSHKGYGEDELEDFFFPLILLHGFSFDYDIDREFFLAAGNLVSAFNYTYKYQKARDLCEELLIISINKRKHFFGWNILFDCYTHQKSLFDAAIYGCLYLSSISGLPELPEESVVDAAYGALKFFRNFGYSEFAKTLYLSLKELDLKEYDEQKISVSYFNSFFLGPVQEDVLVLDQAIDYIELKISQIIKYGGNGIVPWLGFLYNVKKLNEGGEIEYKRKIDHLIIKFEEGLDPKTVEDTRKRILGNSPSIKEDFIKVLHNIFETRSISDFVYESQNLKVLSNNLIQQSIRIKDFDGLFLAGLAVNDQSFVYVNKDTELGTVSPIFKSINQELDNTLKRYLSFLLERVQLNKDQLFLWLLENSGQVFGITVSSNKEVELIDLKSWSIKEMNSWVKGISNFYFNSKKDQYNNPRKEYFYDSLIQEEDYKKLQTSLVFTEIKTSKEYKELLFCSSITLSGFPYHLIQDGGDFISAMKPICNVLSIERFIENSGKSFLKRDYTVSAWIPSDDKEPTISWGFSILQPLLKEIKAKLFTSTYPRERIDTDLNIFLAHGVLDSTGFKAIYTNHETKKAITFPHEVFGSGRVAILFVCNSGSSNEEFLSNSVVSFSGELLKSGYESVVAPFWPFDVTMSKIWLEEFLHVFGEGFSISESVFLANHKLSKYDEESSNFFFAPSGRLAMHLYGNPNLYVE